MTDTKLEPLFGVARLIKGIVLDVDGVLTDGKITYASDGSELKSFNVQDGSSLKLLARQAIAIAIITGRQSNIVERRAKELGITFVQQDVYSKASALDQMISNGFPASDLCAIGDDLQDLELFDHSAVTLNATVANAHPIILDRAQFVTQRPGGAGVIIELAELILRAKDRWPHA